MTGDHAVFADGGTEGAEIGGPPAVPGEEQAGRRGLHEFAFQPELEVHPAPQWIAAGFQRA